MRGLGLFLRGQGQRSRSQGQKMFFFLHFGLVGTISQKVMDGFSPNLHRICILDSFQSLMKMGELDLHLQGHLGKKHENYAKLGRFGADLHDQLRSHFLSYSLQTWRK